LQQQAFSQQAGLQQQAGSGQQAFAWQHVSHVAQHLLHAQASLRPQNKSRILQHFFSQQTFSQQAGSGAQHLAACSQQAGFAQPPHSPQLPHRSSPANPWL
jgi:hypothetical protein